MIENEIIAQALSEEDGILSGVQANGAMNKKIK